MICNIPLTFSSANSNFSHLRRDLQMAWQRRFSVFLILLLLVSTFAAVVHHHDNTAGEHDCPICLVTNHQQATSQSTVAFDGIPFIAETIHNSPAQNLVEQIVISLLKNRAPPV